MLIIQIQSLCEVYHRLMTPYTAELLVIKKVIMPVIDSEKWGAAFCCTYSEKCLLYTPHKCAYRRSFDLDKIV